MPKAFDELAATGRGLRIVEATTLGWGVDLHRDGKTVWADLALPNVDEVEDTLLRPGERAGRGDSGRRDRPQPGGGPSRTQTTGPSSSPPVGSERTAARTGLEDGAPPVKVQRVSYRGVPVTDYIAMRARVEAMLRESTLIVLGGDHEDIPAVLLELAVRATTKFEAVARAQASALPEPVAVDEESGTGEFVVDFPVSAVDQLLGFGDVVHSLNDWCASSHLLVSPLTPEMRELHHWTMSEAARQLGGSGGQRPFGGYRFEPARVQPDARPWRSQRAPADQTAGMATR